MKEKEIEKEKAIEVARENRLKQEAESLAISARLKHDLEKAELELKNNLEQLKIKTEADLRMFEVKQKLETENAKPEKSNGENKCNSHTRIRLPFYKETEEIQIYLERFEMICRNENINEKHWPTRLMELLQGDQLALIFSLSTSDRLSYEKIKEALLLRFGLTTEKLRRKFWETLAEKKQTFLEYSSHIQHLFDRWIQSTKIDQSFKSLRELIITSKLLDSVDKPLYSYLIEQKPDSLENLVKTAINYAEAHPGIPFAKQQMPQLDIAFTQAAFTPYHQQNASASQQQNNNAGKKFKKKPKYTTNQQAFHNANSNMQQLQDSSFVQNTNLSNNNNQLQLYNNQQQGNNPGFTYNNQQNQNYNRRGPRFQYYNRGRPWAFNPNWGNRNNFNNNQQQQQNTGNNNNYRGNNYRGYSFGYNQRSFYNNPSGNSFIPDQNVINMNSDEMLHVQNEVNPPIQSAAFAKAIPSEDCKMCATLFQENHDTLLQCGHKLPVAMLASNSQGNLRFDYGFIGSKPTKILRDSGSSILGISRSCVKPEGISDKTLKCITIGGTIEKFNLTRVEIRTPYISGVFDAIVLPRPIVNLVLGNLPGIRSPSEQEIEDWYKKNGLADKDLHCASAISTRSAVQKERQKLADVPPAINTDEDTPQVGTHSTNKFVEEQEADTTLSTCFKKIGLPKTKCKYGTVSYDRHNGILCRTFTRDNVDFRQIVLPSKYRNETLRLSHDVPMSAHLGTKKTTDRVKRHFFWPGMTKDVRNYCRSCEICQKLAKKGTTPIAPVQSSYLTSTPWEKVSLGIFGPLPPTKKHENRYVLCVVDHASRWPEAVAMKNIDLESICESLLSIFSRFGFPKTILSDNGPQFTSALTTQVAKTLGIQQKFSSFYHPQANGLCEKLCGVLKTLLAKISYDHPENWDFFLNPALFALREITHESTGFSPAELILGSNPRGILSIYKDLITQQEVSKEKNDTYSYVLELRERIISSCNMAHQALKISGEKSRIYSNKRARLIKFNPNDKVLILLPEKTNKLLISWQGPFNIDKQISLVDYIVDVKGKKKIFHVNMLRKYYERPAFLEELITDSGMAPLPSGNSAVISIPDETSNSDLPNTIIVPSLKRTESIDNIKISPSLSSTQNTQVKNILKDFSDVFSDIPGRTSTITHKIVLNSDVPVRSRPYPIPLHFRDQVEKEIKEMLNMGIIEESDSEYLSPMIVLRKKDNTLRLCIDFRRLNAITKLDPVPMPNAQDLLSNISEAKYFSKIDLTKGFYQIMLSNDSKKYTAFQTSENLYQFRTLPFGLCNSPSTFVRLMRKVLGHLPNVLHYYDDILIFSNNYEPHLQDLTRVLESLRQHGLTAKPSKTEIGFEKLTYLGHKVGGGFIQPDDSNLSKIFQIKTPTTRRQVRQILGLLNYYNEFIEGYSTIVNPLNDLLRGLTKQKLPWTAEHDRILDRIKSLFSTAPILLAPNLEKPFVLATDCSGTAMGFCLKQEREGLLHPISYGSRMLSPSEKKLSTIERELLCMAMGILKYSRYLLGSHFTVEVDHKPIKYLQTKAISNPRLLRYLLQLQEYSFSIVTIQGIHHFIPDILSRL
ncbi:hypothetical protein BsWGS_27585 [Bradybaena similaris]